MNTVCHITSVHPRNDIRVFVKESQSLSRAGYNVILLVADGEGDDLCNGVRIIDVGKVNGRLKRMIKMPKVIYKKALELDADVYHFHDPELIPAGLRLRKRNKVVVYDAHEDVPRQIYSKPYLSPWQMKTISKIFEMYENHAAKKFNFIITATGFIRDRFKKINNNTIDINNYPILDELSNNVGWDDKNKEICYIGGITEIRGINELMNALEFVDVKLNLAGNFADKILEGKIINKAAWQKVCYSGFVNREEVSEIMARSIAGIVLFLSLPNHINSQPNKMFEYMSAGLPVISSNFPLWKEIVEENECGICVDPENPHEVADAINKLQKNPILAKQMGQNGRKAVEEKYNWMNEEKKLIEIYRKIISNVSGDSIVN